MARTPALIAAYVTLLLLSGCTPAASSPPSDPATNISSPPTATSPVSPSASPTPTWSAEQAAAIAAVDEYRAASRKIWSNPAAFSEKAMRALLKPLAGPEVVNANVGSYLNLKKRGFRYDGDTTVLSTLASRASEVGYGTEVVVTHCLDQRSIRVLDTADRKVGTAELGYDIPDFNLRQYRVQKRTTDKAFRVYGLAPTKGACGP